MKTIDIIANPTVWLVWNIFWTHRYGWHDIKEGYLFKNKVFSWFLYLYLGWIIFATILCARW